jgi:hypothetical protein
MDPTARVAGNLLHDRIAMQVGIAQCQQDVEFDPSQPRMSIFGPAHR